MLAKVKKKVRKITEYLEEVAEPQPKPGGLLPLLGETVPELGEPFTIIGKLSHPVVVKKETDLSHTLPMIFFNAPKNFKKAQRRK